MTEHQEYEIDALKNNTFDFVSLGETLKELRESSFNFLYINVSIGIMTALMTMTSLLMYFVKSIPHSDSHVYF